MRAPAGLPGFARPGARAAEAPARPAAPAPKAPEPKAAAVEEAPAAAPERPAAARRARGDRARTLDVALDPKDKYQAQFYGLNALKRHYERLVFELKQDGEATSMTELFNAVLLHGPADADEARKLLHALRDHGR